MHLRGLLCCVFRDALLHTTVVMWVIHISVIFLLALTTLALLL